jgi:predicted deacetylase
MPPPRRLLLASIHDVSPRFESEVDQLLDALEPHVGRRLAMLVVPNHWGDAPIVPKSSFARRLREWANEGAEMFLHGFYHRDTAQNSSSGDRLRARLMTAGEGEFLGLDYASALSRIRDGRALLEDVTGHSIAGFIAPAWLYGRGAHEALRDERVPIAEDHFHVWSPSTAERLANGPVITWASRSRLRLASSLAAAAALSRAPIEVLRIGVHPPDVRHPALMRSIDRTLAVGAKQRRPASYSELLASGRSEDARMRA